MLELAMMAVLFTWVTGGLLCANMAGIKGHNAMSWFLVSLVCSPLLALIAVAGLPCAPGYPVHRELKPPDKWDPLR